MTISKKVKVKIKGFLVVVSLFLVVSAIGQDAYISVKAEKGDGVYSLLR